MAKIPVEAGKEYEIKIGSLGSSGEGVGRYNGFTVFVPGALPQEKVKVRILEVKKTYAAGKLLKVLGIRREMWTNKVSYTLDEIKYMREG